MENFKFWANKQKSYFGDPGTYNRDDLKINISECQMLLREQMENVKFNYSVVIIICYVLLLVIILLFICFSCYAKHNITKKHCRSTQNVE